MEPSSVESAPTTFSPTTHALDIIVLPLDNIAAPSRVGALSVADFERQMTLVSLEDKALFDSYLKKYQPQASEMTFTNLFCWNVVRPHYFLETQGHLIVGYFDERDTFKLFQPIGPRPEQVVMQLSEDLDTVEWVRVEEAIASKVTGENFSITHDRDNSDYLYFAADIRALAGKKYHQKRTFVNQCSRLQPTTITLDRSSARLCFDVNRKWLQSKCNPNDTDVPALERALLHFDALGLSGIGIVIGGTLEAFAIGEPLNDSTFVWHFMKANTEHPGLFQYISHVFAKYMPESFVAVNMEQDMGMPGLRTAKERWYPSGMENKYTIKAKE